MAKDQNPVCSFKTSDIDTGSQNITKIPKLTADPHTFKTHVKATIIEELPYGTMIILNPAERPSSQEFPMGEKRFEENLKNKSGERNILEGEKIRIRAMLEESHLRIFVPYDNLMDETQSRETSIITMIEPWLDLCNREYFPVLRNEITENSVDLQ